jgi:hypothetical protein
VYVKGLTSTTNRADMKRKKDAMVAKEEFRCAFADAKKK